MINLFSQCTNLGGGRYICIKILNELDKEVIDSWFKLIVNASTCTLPRRTTNCSAEKALYKLRLYNPVLPKPWHARLQCYTIREPPLRVKWYGYNI